MSELVTGTWSPAYGGRKRGEKDAVNAYQTKEIIAHDHSACLS